MKKRDASIDIVRGLAVFIMVLANLGPVIAEPHAFIYRLYGSFAAPLFIMLVGMMVALGAIRGQHGIGYYAIRGAMVVAVGALVDGLAWHVVPFHTIDVLYLIGVSIPFVYAATRLKAKGMAIGACVIFALAPILQLAIGYGAYPLEPLFDGTYTVSPEETTGVLQHWFIDGWFPLVPWFGFALAGGALGAYQSDKMEDVLPKFGSIEIVGVTMIGVGGIAWFLYPGAMYSREGFSELFYPPVPGFLLAATGFTIVLLYLARFTQSWAGYSPLRALGEASLFMYVIHSIFIGRVVFEHFEGLTHIEGLGIFAGMIIVMIGLGYGIRRLKKLPQSRHPALRFVLGG